MRVAEDGSMQPKLPMGKELKEYTWNLIAKKLAGEATPDELKELEALLRNNPELHYPMQTITDLWRHTNPLDKAQVEKAFSEHLDRISDLEIDFTPATPAQSGDEPFPAKRRNSKRIALYITPAACLAIVMTWYNHSHSAKTPPLRVAAVHAAVPSNTGNEIYTANGSRTHLSLPDGTKVWLNAGSRIDYGKNYGLTCNGVALREVQLTGEAFFDVAPDAHKPFIVHTRGIDIRVLGTSFNVKSYPSDKTTEATLIHGSIEVSIRNRPKDKIILKPNEKLVVSNDDSLMKAPAPRRRQIRPESLLVISKPTYEQHSGAIIETSWVDNKLIFQSEGFSELARQMERWYGVTIRFDNPQLAELQFTGSFEKETVAQAMEALRFSVNDKFNYSIEGNEVTIHD